MHEPQPTAASSEPLPSPWRPTLAPPGRLVRLGVTLDLRGPVERLREVALMCDRAGIGALWVDEPAGTLDTQAPGPGNGPDREGTPGRAPAIRARPEPGQPAGPVPGAGSTDPGTLDAWTALVLVAPVVSRLSLGAMFLAGVRPAGVLARMAATLGAALGGRLEVGLRTAEGGDVGAELALLLRALAPVAAGAGGRGAAAHLPPLSAELPAGAAAPVLGQLAAAADNVLLPPAGPQAGVEEVVALATELRRAAADAGRDPATLGIAARLPVSVGRTKAEAQARWDASPALASLGPPERVAVFGTLERCHETVIGLAHAGVTELRCLLPDAIDIHDVIAQLTAMSVGTIAQLAPGTPRSPAPEPPPGWGGRPRFPREPSAGR